MAATSHVYGLALQSLVSGQINFTGSTVRAILLTSSYAPNRDTHRWKSDLSGEAVGTGYTAGGLIVTTKTVVFSGGSDTLTLGCDNPVWTATVSARYIVFFVDTGTASTSPLISYVDFGADVTATGGAWTYPVPSAGIAQLTAA